MHAIFTTYNLDHCLLAQWTNFAGEVMKINLSFMQKPIRNYNKMHKTKHFNLHCVLNNLYLIMCLNHKL